jgi:hypothetical protein
MPSTAPSVPLLAVCLVDPFTPSTIATVLEKVSDDEGCVSDGCPSTRDRIRCAGAQTMRWARVTDCSAMGCPVINYAAVAQHLGRRSRVHALRSTNSGGRTAAAVPGVPPPLYRR